MKNHIIYVPGLGDHKKYGQPFILFWWRIFGVHVHYHAIGWQGQDWAQKQQALLDKIDEVGQNGRIVSLVGVSAGASAVLNTYAKTDKVHRVICICGKINNPQTVGQRVYAENPAFKKSLYELQESINSIGKEKRSNIMSIHPVEDKVVPPEDTIINSALEVGIPTRGHVFSIFYCLVFKTSLICSFIKA